MEAEVCLCLWFFLGCLFLQVFKFYWSVIYECWGAYPSGSLGWSPVAVWIPLTCLWNLPRRSGSLNVTAAYGEGGNWSFLSRSDPPAGTWKASTINAENQTAVVKNFPLVGMLLANDGDKRGLPVKSFPCLINSCVILPLIQSKTLRQHLKACFVWSAAGYRAFPFLFFNKFEANVVGIVSLFSIFWPM